MLAWSVHAADAELRRQLVPSSRKHPPEVLREALSSALSSRPGRARTLMIAVTLLEGINDRPDDAMKLAMFLKPLFRVVKKIAVDLIPYNPHDGAPVEYRRPSRERVQVSVTRSQPLNAPVALDTTHSSTQMFRAIHSSST